jgi:hypothetical protein
VEFNGTTLDHAPEPEQPRDPAPTKTAAPERTRRMVLDELALSLAAAQTEVDIHLIESSADVKKAFATFKNGLREELDALFAEAWKRLAIKDDAAEAEEPFLGDATP